ncbi:RalA-binding protein 1 [Cichlidogyrus casuarinus]|uniref:RalA-binding protein 1 n=1 Tax=Cichlidogyrus casuarinus TaxID=1844966 RepID=A0ABD2QMY4_9PLAT
MSRRVQLPGVMENNEFMPSKILEDLAAEEAPEYLLTTRPNTASSGGSTSVPVEDHPQGSISSTSSKKASGPGFKLPVSKRLSSVSGITDKKKKKLKEKYLQEHGLPSDTVLDSDIEDSVFGTTETAKNLPQILAPLRKPSISKQKKKKISKHSKKQKTKQPPTPIHPSQLLEQLQGQDTNPPPLPVFGVELETACANSYSHDGIPLPAFFRSCVDFIEEYGINKEGIYRVPGVQSQVTSLVNALNRGVEFSDIPPTSAAFYHHNQIRNRNQNPAESAGTQAQSAPRQIIGKEEVLSIEGSVPAPPPHDPFAVASLIKYFLREMPQPLLSKQVSLELERAIDVVDTEAQPSEFSPMQLKMQRIGEIIHSTLSRHHRYLLAWLVQHLGRVIQHSGENMMSVTNLAIVFSPALNISHRVLSILVSNTRDPKYVAINGWDVESRFSSRETHLITSPTIIPHWLFPDEAFRLRVYRAPLRPLQLRYNELNSLSLLLQPPHGRHDSIKRRGPAPLSSAIWLQGTSRNAQKLQIGSPMPTPQSEISADSFLELVEDAEELSNELFKQKSLLDFLTNKIAEGYDCNYFETLFWETQRIVTQLKRKKHLLELTDPLALRTELDRQESQLNKMHSELITTKEERPKRDKKRRDSTKKGHIEKQDSNVREADIWYTQRIITMLKRKLRQYEKVIEDSAASDSHDLQQQELPSGFLKPTPLEALDEEEVLNLTLRKLPPMLPQKTEAETPSLEPVEETEESPKMEEKAQEPVMTPPKLPVIPPRPKPEPPLPPPLPAKPAPILDLAKAKLIAEIQFLDCKQHESLANRADLFSRLNSEQEEINRIKAHIEYLLKEGGDKIWNYYVTHLASGRLLRHGCSILQSLDHLTDLESLKMEDRQSYPALMTDPTQIDALYTTSQLLGGVHVNPYEQLVNDSAQWFNHSEILNGASSAVSVGSYSEDRAGLLTSSSMEESLRLLSPAHTDKDFYKDMQRISARLDDSDSNSLAEDELSSVSGDSSSSSPLQMSASSNSSDQEEEDEEEEDVEQKPVGAGDEFEQAAVLFQLIKDNVELDKLNTALFDRIQAERSQCTELKVMLRNNLNKVAQQRNMMPAPNKS